MTPADDRQPPRRGRGPMRAGALLGPQIRAVGEQRGFAVSRLLTHWAEIAGPELARVARPAEVSYGRGFGATLTLLVEGAHAPVVEMQKERLREKVNACYGYNAISRIRLTQTAPEGFAEPAASFAAKPAEPPPEVAAAARATVEGVGDETLRAALETLGRRILATQKST